MGYRLYCMCFSMSYFLMLFFMAYNFWLCTAVVMGVAFGYFF